MKKPSKISFGGAVLSKFAVVFAALVLCFVTLKPGAAQATVYPGGVWEPSPAKYGLIVVYDVPVTMDDGVLLHANK